ncbi:hypothetical protein MTO96_020382 [Rhipicephalus appendiculatus]
MRGSIYDRSRACASTSGSPASLRKTDDSSSQILRGEGETGEPTPKKRSCADAQSGDRFLYRLAAVAGRKAAESAEAVSSRKHPIGRAQPTTGTNCDTASRPLSAPYAYRSPAYPHPHFSHLFRILFCPIGGPKCRLSACRNQTTARRERGISTK